MLAPHDCRAGSDVMTPKQYLDRYTYLKFFSPWNNGQISAGISNYGSGWDKRNFISGKGKIVQTECLAFIRALRAAHHGNPNTPCGAKIFFNQRSLGLIRSDEEFYPETFTHAFDGKGSPDEIIDTLRVAMAIGRIGESAERDYARQPPARQSVQAYATDFMTLDCNGLVGNFFGVNPSNSIDFYAAPQRRRTSAGNVRVGDAVVTHCSQYPYEHVGLIADWSASGSTATVRIVEWGTFGDESKHYSKPGNVTIVQGPEKTLGVGWVTKSNLNPNVDSFKYIFAPPGDNEPHGWS